MDLLQVYGEDGFSFRDCHDPAEDDGNYNKPDMCISGLHCWTNDDGHQDCHNGTICTCDGNLCNGLNATTPAPVTRSTNKNTHQCYFGEKHPGHAEVKHYLKTNLKA